MTYPIINDYKQAVRNIKSRLTTLKVVPLHDKSNNPVFLSGNFAGVFKVTEANNPQQVIALKCFIRDLPDLVRRQQAISKFIQKTAASYLIPVKLLKNELFVTSSVADSKDYHVVTMPWIDGKSIGYIIEKLCRSENHHSLTVLTHLWARMCIDMLNKGIAHGDLKHDNIIIDNKGQLKLIDYDSMYLPNLTGLGSTLLGGVNYQHPKRKVKHFGKNIDHFSMLVITLSLRALTLEPELFTKYNDGENIILSAEDFNHPAKSKLLNKFIRSQDSLVRDSSKQLIRACNSNSISVMGLKSLLKRARTVTADNEKITPFGRLVNVF